MRKNHLIGFLSAAGFIFYLSGCVSVPYISPPRTDQASLTFDLNIASEPSDADIYINNILYGRTPQASLPLVVSCANRKDWTQESYTVQGQYILMVSKKGYRSEARPLEFTYVWSGANNEEYRPYLKEKKFHFKLAKEE